MYFCRNIFSCLWNLGTTATSYFLNKHYWEWGYFLSFLNLFGGLTLSFLSLPLRLYLTLPLRGMNLWELTVCELKSGWRSEYDVCITTVDSSIRARSSSDRSSFLIIMRKAGGIIPTLSGLEFFLPPVSQRKTKVMNDIFVVFRVKMTEGRLDIRSTTP